MEIKRDAYDAYKFQEHLDASEDGYGKRIKEYEDYRDSAEDIFQAMFKRKWRYKDDAGNKEIREFIDTLKQTEEYKELRSVTVRNSGEAWEATRELMQRYSDIMDKKDAQRRRIAIRQAARAAKESAEEYAEMSMMAGLGAGDQVGTETREDNIDRIKAIQKLIKNDACRKILELAGKMVSTASHQLETKVDRGDMKLVGVEHGNNLSRILPSELVISGKCPELLALRMLEGQLMQYKYGGQAPQTGGPVIVCVDESSSMLDGGKRDFARAFLYGMWLVAETQRRDFVVLRFDVRTLRHDIKRTRDLLAFIDKHMNGGTNYNAPLTHALAILKGAYEDNSGYAKSDIIFLSDGESSVSPEVLEQISEFKKNRGLKIIGALFGADTSEVLPKFCDEVFAMKDLSGMTADEFVKKAYTI